MGQIINVTTQVLDDVALFDADRSITGQDGSAYANEGEAELDTTFPGRLAHRLFGVDSSIGHVFVASNQVVVRRSGGWPPAALKVASETISEFFVFYPA
ncbi:MAG: hypothetical protein HKN07_01850 [Acidimicrobiia bacterium]|nr:hypothetical protein [Acidimicrobiia bacterium]